MSNMVLMLRSWEPLAHSGTYSTSMSKGLGGTDQQLLMHCQALRSMGYEVTVLGITTGTVEERGVTFQGSRSREETLGWLRRNRDGIRAIFFNPREWAERIKESAPKAAVVQVCQNGPFFEYSAYIDIYAMASPGQMALYCVNEPRHRNKFMLLPNAISGERVYGGLTGVPKPNQIVWVVNPRPAPSGRVGRFGDSLGRVEMANPVAGMFSRDHGCCRPRRRVRRMWF